MATDTRANGLAAPDYLYTRLVIASMFVQMMPLVVEKRFANSLHISVFVGLSRRFSRD
jgi:hypothetical protein